MARRVALLFDPHRLERRQRQLLAGVRRYAERAGEWRLAFDPDAADHLPGPYDGVIAPGGSRIAARTSRAGVPAVCVTWRSYKARVPRVLENRPRAGLHAARHLLERGYRRFAYLGFSARCESRMERFGFCRWLEWRGRPLTTCRIPVTYNQSRERWARLTRALDKWLGRLTPPVGIFCARDALARTLADIALRRGLRIPDDVGIIGAGNDPVVCEIGGPPLTSIEFHYEDVGYYAAQLLDRLLDGEPPPRRNVLIAPTVVARRSTARSRVDDPIVAQALYWIETHSREPIRAGQVAEAIGLGQRALEKRLRRAGRATIVREIVRARIEHARLFLETSDDPPATIAHLVGFHSRRHFERAFRREEGCTPLQYRQHHKRPPPPGLPDFSITFYPP